MRVDSAVSPFLFSGLRDRLQMGLIQVFSRLLRIGLTEKFQDPHVKILTDVDLSQEQLQAISRRIQEAYAFNLKQEQWADPQATAGQIDVLVFSTERFNSLFPPGVGGATLDKNTILLPEAFVTSKRPIDVTVLAHELLHIQDFRQAGSRFIGVPVYFREGKAFVIGDSYGERTEDNNLYIRTLAREMSQLTDEQLRPAFADTRPTFDNELGGALFIEYLRTRLDGAGLADAWQRAAEVVNQVGEGVSYDDAFDDQFGRSAAEAVEGFLAFVDQTEGNAAERLRGTIYEQPPGLPFPPETDQLPPRNRVFLG
jgi:hypothetical protein